MYLKGLELFGFKSFADRVKMDIEPGITGIVGPNGSGKSNIVEAIKWVLGEQSAKSLRGQKMEDLIFNGTKKRKALGMAEISLILDNSDGYLPLEYTDIRVTRRLYRSGDSEYLLNGKNCRLKDILRLFADSGIGNDGYAIIGQGRITEILAARPEERRGIIEETAGIVKYRERKREALRKLDQADQNLLRIEDIIGEIAGRLGPLRAEAEAAQSYIAAKKELDELETGFLAEQILTNRRRRSELEQSLGEEEGKAQALAANLLAKETALGEKKALQQRLEEEYGVAAGHCQAERQKLQTLEGEIETLSSRILGHEEKMELLATELTSFRKKDEDRDALLRQEEARFSALEAQKEQLQRQCTALEEKRALEEAELVAAEKSLETLREDAFEWARESGNRKNRRTSLLESQAGSGQRRRSLEEKIRQYREEQALLQERKEEITALATALEEKNRGHQAKSRDLSARDEALVKDAAAGESSLAAARMTLHKAEARLKILEDMEQRWEGFYPGIKAILGEKQRFPGLLGVVAELIRVEPTYATAIETALGGALQNIVSSNADEARRAIEFLKVGKRGNATFLPLDMLRIPEPLAKERLTGQPGFCGVGSDLVQAPRQVRPAIDFLLNHTVVVGNLEQAIAISRRYKKSARYVTLDGDIIHGGGSISGGSRNQNKSGLLSRKSEIEALRRTILAAKDDEAKQIAAGEELQRRREQIKDDLAALERKVRENEGEISTYQGELNTIALREDFFRRELEALVQEKQDLETADAAAEAELTQLGLDIAEAEAKQVEMEERLAATEKDMQAAKGRESDVRRAHTEIQVEMAAMAKEWENSRKNLERLGDEKSLQSQDIAARERLHAEAAGQKAAAEAKIASLKENILAQALAIRNAEAELNRLAAEKDDCRSAIAGLEKEVRELRAGESGGKERCHQLALQRERLLADEEQLEEKLQEQYQCTVETAAAYIREEIPKREKQQRIVGLRRSIALLGQVNLGAIREFADVSERHEFLTAQRDDMVEARNSLRKLVEQIDEVIIEKFRETFVKINESFQQTFPEFFQGGYGELQLTDPDNLLESGVDIIVQPPGKRLQHHGLLSGGEKSLCGIALLFAILRVKPSPFYVLDEIDAALDDINVRRFASYLQRYAGESQFLVITHRQGTMESAGELYGITMEEEGISKTISVKLVG